MSHLMHTLCTPVTPYALLSSCVCASVSRNVISFSTLVDKLLPMEEVYPSSYGRSLSISDKIFGTSTFYYNNIRTLSEQFRCIKMSISVHEIVYFGTS